MIFVHHTSLPRATSEERAARKIYKKTLEKAVVALSEDGVIVVDGAVSAESLDLANLYMVGDARALRDGHGMWLNYDNRAQNILQHMIPGPEHLVPDVHANPSAPDMCKPVVGPKPVLRYHKANTNSCGQNYQPVVEKGSIILLNILWHVVMPTRTREEFHISK
ncbi:hypothetical protein F4775DRAFT_602490 [Biscogniauxia sp. FL1348]|nr:hypothetical protein F4775DRAFT_602490 [Biscogniauxia sp. FL1348]